MGEFIDKTSSSVILGVEETLSEDSHRICLLFASANQPGLIRMILATGEPQMRREGLG